MVYAITFIHVLVSIFLILVVLLQQGKGADLSVFGGGGTQVAFGARGAATVLHKLTVTCFVLFLVTTVTLGILAAGDKPSVMRGVGGDTTAAEELPPMDGPAGGTLEDSGAADGESGVADETDGATDPLTDGEATDPAADTDTDTSTGDGGSGVDGDGAESDGGR